MSAEIGGAHLGIVEKIAALALKRDAAGLQHIGAIGNAERLVGHLLDEQDGETGLAQGADCLLYTSDAADE